MLPPNYQRLPVQQNPPHVQKHSGKRDGLSHAGKGNWTGSDRQFLAATATAGGENAAAVLGAHAGTETVNLIALALFRLKSVLHEINNSF